jgi:hypothetical protein
MKRTLIFTSPIIVIILIAGFLLLRDRGEDVFQEQLLDGDSEHPTSTISLEDVVKKTSDNQDEQDFKAPISLSEDEALAYVPFIKRETWPDRRLSKETLMRTSQTGEVEELLFIENEDFSISPGLHYAVYQARDAATNEETLRLIDIVQRENVLLYQDIDKAINISYILWSSDESRIVFIQKDKATKKAELVSIDIRTKEVRLARHPYDRNTTQLQNIFSFWISHDGKFILFGHNEQNIKTNISLALFDVEGRKTVNLRDGYVFVEFFDFQGNVFYKDLHGSGLWLRYHLATGQGGVIEEPLWRKNLRDVKSNLERKRFAYKCDNICLITDAGESLDPIISISDILLEPMKVNQGYTYEWDPLGNYMYVQTSSFYADIGPSVRRKALWRMSLNDQQAELITSWEEHVF